MSEDRKIAYTMLPQHELQELEQENIELRSAIEKVTRRWREAAALANALEKLILNALEELAEVNPR